MESDQIRSRRTGVGARFTRFQRGKQSVRLSKFCRTRSFSSISKRDFIAFCSSAEMVGRQDAPEEYAALIEGCNEKTVRWVFLASHISLLSNYVEHIGNTCQPIMEHLFFKHHYILRRFNLQYLFWFFSDIYFLYNGKAPDLNLKSYSIMILYVVLWR